MSSSQSDPGLAGFNAGYTPGPVPGLPTSPYGGYPAGPTYSRARNALILGVLAIPLSVITGIPAMVVGTRALRIFDASDGELKGRGSAWCGIVLGGLSVAAFIGLLYVTYR